MAAQDQALRTNSVKRLIDKQNISSTCRMCGDRVETVAQNQYKSWRHDKVAQVIHWDLSEKCGFERELNWYDHKPNPVCESERQTDRHSDHHKPDIVLLNEEDKSCLIIDVACPFDTRIDSKEREKIENYHDLKHEMKRIWNCRSVLVIPAAIGALGTVSGGLGKWLNLQGMPYNMELLQRVCLLGTARIIRKVQDT